MQSSYAAEERVTRESLYDRSLDELKRVSRWVQSAQNGGVRVIAMMAARLSKIVRTVSINACRRWSSRVPGCER